MKRKRTPNAQVFLNEQAFIVLVVAAVEAYKKECYGFLLGNRRHGRIYIKIAFAYQTARRTPNSARLYNGRRRTLRRVLKAFPHYEYLGEFHSHPGFDSKLCLSDDDINGVRPGECELVISVRRARAYMPWRKCYDGSLSGVAGRHFVKMRVYLAEQSGRGEIYGRISGLGCTYAVTAANSSRLLDKLKNANGP